MKKSFVLYLDQYEPIKDLTDEQKGQLLDAMFQYNCGADFEVKDPILKMAFSFFKQTFDRDTGKWLRKAEKNRENGKKGGRPKKRYINELLEEQRNPNNPDGLKETQHNPTEPKKAVSGSVSVNVSDSVNVNGSDIKDKEHLSSAKNVITKLNELANKKFRFGTNNTTNIISRLKDGFTEEDCLKVLATKIQDPHFIKSPQFFNPETLFRPSKFEKYLNEDPANYPKDTSMKKNGFGKEGYYQPSSTGDSNEHF